MIGLTEPDDTAVAAQLKAVSAARRMLAVFQVI
jgi:hypothetical protein